MNNNMDFNGLVVSIVTYNNQENIKEVIESIIEHSQGIDFKIVVFDNFSSDDTVSLIKSIKCDKIDVVESKYNYGFGYGHNRNAERYPLAENYLIYNPDLFLTDNLLYVFSKKMKENEHIGLLVPRVEYPNGDLQYLCKRNPTFFDLFMRRFLKSFNCEYLRKRQYYYEMRDKDYNETFGIEYASGCCMFIRGETYRSIGGFDENIFMYLEDADITRRINITKKSMYEPSNKVKHIWNKGAHHSIKLMLINIKSAFYYFNKWGWKMI
ncbi:hypothetical protein SAMN02910356_00725 [Selenomonas sp. GACV-9]|uniref:glycosyltransferase n=1 Tax=Selenomonas sp. GACV-9 TaxID=3158782 RepID=UPI0008E09A70|nr:hypothetical protein SAMN02910356_00725 [Selenomonas ruminantium]